MHLHLHRQPDFQEVFAVQVIFLIDFLTEILLKVVRINRVKSWDANMRAAETVELALLDRRSRERVSPVEIVVEWPGHPGWRLLRVVTAVRFMLGDIFACSIDLVGSGPGCFYVIYSLDTNGILFREKYEAVGRIKLRDMKMRFEIGRIMVRCKDFRRTIIC